MNTENILPSPHSVSNPAKFSPKSLTLVVLDIIRSEGGSACLVEITYAVARKLPPEVAVQRFASEMRWRYGSHGAEKFEARPVEQRILRGAEHFARSALKIMERRGKVVRLDSHRWSLTSEEVQQ